MNGPTRQLLRSASNYLSASAFLLREPGVEESEYRLIERASALIEEATSIMDAIKQSRAGAPQFRASLRALVEKASGWLITPGGALVALDVSIGENAGFVDCEPGQFATVLESLFAKACAALDKTTGRRIVVATRRIDDRVAIEIRYAAPVLHEVFKDAPTERAAGDLPPGPALPDYRRIIADAGGTLAADYGAAGQIVLRLSFPAG